MFAAALTVTVPVVPPPIRPAPAVTPPISPLKAARLTDLAPPPSLTLSVVPLRVTEVLYSLPITASASFTLSVEFTVKFGKLPETVVVPVPV